MGKRSLRCPKRCDKNHSGCTWDFMNLFDFHLGHATRKLLSDRRRSSRDAVGSVHSKNKFDLLSNLDGHCQGTIGNRESKAAATVMSVAGKPSVKKLLEEEMFSVQDMKEIRDDRREKLFSLGNESLLRTKKGGKKSCSFDSLDLSANVTSEVSCNQHLRQYSLNNLDLDKLTEEFCHQIYMKSTTLKHDPEGKVDMHTNVKHGKVEESVREAIQKFVYQKIFEGKHLPHNGKLHLSNDLLGAIQIISSDKEWIPKLLENPNSTLLKYLEELQDVEVEKEKEYNLASVKMSKQEQLHSLGQSRDIINDKQWKLFKQKVRSLDTTSTKVNSSCEESNKIVILKPASKVSQHFGNESSPSPSPDFDDIEKYRYNSDRVGSHFFLAEIKRKLKHAMGKERYGVSSGIIGEHQKMSGKFTCKEHVGGKSPNKDNFFVEKISVSPIDKKGDKTCIRKDSETIWEHESCRYPKQEESEIYNEAKKHLYEMLGNGDEDKDSSTRKLQKTLGRILSLPEYSFSPIGSPGRDGENGFMTARMRLLANDKFQKTNGKISSPREAISITHMDHERHILESQERISDETLANKFQPLSSSLKCSNNLINDKVENKFYSIEDEIIPEVGGSSVAGLDQICVRNISDDERNSECSNHGLSEENHLPACPLSSPPCTSISRNTEDIDCTTARPSPVSVLEPPFADDSINSANNISQPVQLPMQPLQIQFEDFEYAPTDQVHSQKHTVRENESIFYFVQAVLLASGLNWDKLWMKCLSSNEILDPTLLYELEFFPDLIFHDQKLLFDCINEVLGEFSQHYFGVSPWVSYVKPSIRPIPSMEKAAYRVFEGLCWHLLELPLPRALDQIVRKDMAKSEAWMDLRFDAEIIGSEMGEAILAELMEDTISSCVSEDPEN